VLPLFLASVALLVRLDRSHCGPGTRIVILMHPKEYKQIKATTGRFFTHLCLRNSEDYVDIAFDEYPAVQAVTPGDLKLKHPFSITPPFSAYSVSLW
jgi:hypothetical protein